MVRNVAVLLLSSLVLILFWQPMRAGLDLGLRDDRYVQMLAAPLICAFLIYRERKRIFRNLTWGTTVGLPVLAFAVAVFYRFAGGPIYADDTGRLSLSMLAWVVSCMASFILCFGPNSFRAALFPLCCLLLTIPVPAWAMENITVALQKASAAMSYETLRLFGVPVFAQDLRLSLSGLEIEVAPQCSGIRSCIALSLAALVGGRVCLRYGWNLLALVASTVPIAILKNAIRISLIAWLSAYVNRAFLTGPIHRYGGILLTPLGLALLVAFLAGLRTFETRITKRSKAMLPQAADSIEKADFIAL